MGAGISLERRQAVGGRPAIASPHSLPAGDLIPITYSGKIESLNRDPGIASLGPGM